jgi:hypothetical protein
VNIAVYTSCQPRHTTLIERLAKIADTVYACIEVKTLFPGQNEDQFHATDAMQSYFTQMHSDASWGSKRVRQAKVSTREYPRVSHKIG